MLGQIFIYGSLAASLLSVIIYFSKKNNKAASIFYLMTLVMFVAATGYLVANIMSHNYQFTYIWQYSSNELSPMILLSTFYAGQEGSFLLWALMLSFIGYFLIPYSRKYGNESYIMGFFSLILTFLALLLIFKSPFQLIWESFPEENLADGFMPPNGRGLNPILDNYWMIIHPPILFLGYSAIAVPFAFSMASLLDKFKHNRNALKGYDKKLNKIQYLRRIVSEKLHKNADNEWLNISLPWTLFASGMLGLGISLGGYWSYETLGWGGFWAWDPVENSSFLPWLTSIALIHTMLVQRKTGTQRRNGGLIRTNYFLAILGFVLVLYATFLTRSGILGDSSVHSFAEPGALVYALLLGGLIAFFIIGMFAMLMNTPYYFIRRNEMNMSSREFIINIGSITILLLAILVFVGTSWPIISELFGERQSAMEIAVYNQWSLPIGIVMLFAISLSYYLRWKKSDISKTISSLLTPIVISSISLVLFAWAGIDEFKHFFLIFASMLAITVNINFLKVVIKKSLIKSGSYISHIGFAIFLIGVIFSGPLSVNHGLSLMEGESQELFGYKFTFTGKNQIEKELKDREKFEYNVLVEKEGNKETLSAIFYWSDFNRREYPFLEPGIGGNFLKDIYISPSSVEKTLNLDYVILDKNRTSFVPLDSSISMSLTKFDMSQMMDMSATSKAFGSIIEYTIADSIIRDTLYANMDMQSGQAIPIWKLIPGTNIEAGFFEFLANQEDIKMSRAAFAFKHKGKELPEPKDVFHFEVSIKPMINLVWIGSVLLLAGFFIAMINKLKKVKK